MVMFFPALTGLRGWFMHHGFAGMAELVDAPDSKSFESETSHTQVINFIKDLLDKLTAADPLKYPSHNLHTFGVSLAMSNGMSDHEILGGKVKLYKRPRSRFWQCYAHHNNVMHRVSTKEDGLKRAKDFAEDWYLELRGKHKRGEVEVGKAFKDAAAAFETEFRAIATGKRNADYIELIIAKLKNYVIPFFGDMLITKVNGGTLQEYKVDRIKKAQADGGNPPSRSSIHHEVVALRQVLKAAHRKGWLPVMPDLSAAFKESKKVSHRAWFSHDEYERFIKAVRQRVEESVGTNHERNWAQFQDYVLIMANCGLRPDEMARLQYQDVKIIKDKARGDEEILEIDVWQGKRGRGYAYSTNGAVYPFQRLLKRNEGKYQASDLIFPTSPRECMNVILDKLNLKTDRLGNRRSAYSLRHTYICFRLMEGADIYALAKNCRTSVEMIQDHYAAHIKDQISTLQLNTRKPKGDAVAKKRAASKPNPKSARKTPQKTGSRRITS